jgi:hypothetical protein
MASLPGHCDPPTWPHMISSFGSHQESHLGDPVETEVNLIVTILAACENIHNRQVSLKK